MQVLSLFCEFVNLVIHIFFVICRLNRWITPCTIKTTSLLKYWLHQCRLPFFFSYRTIVFLQLRLHPVPQVAVRLIFKTFYLLYLLTFYCFYIYIFLIKRQVTARCTMFLHFSRNFNLGSIWIGFNWFWYFNWGLSLLCPLVVFYLW